jgi:hypothetical protein
MADPLPNSLHVGWEDVYPNDIDCQWVDITGVPAGNYLRTPLSYSAGVGFAVAGADAPLLRVSIRIP